MGQNYWISKNTGLIIPPLLLKRFISVDVEVKSFVVKSCTHRRSLGRSARWHLQQEWQQYGQGSVCSGSEKIGQILQGLSDVKIILTCSLVTVPLILTMFKDVFQTEHSWSDLINTHITNLFPPNFLWLPVKNVFSLHGIPFKYDILVYFWCEKMIESDCDFITPLCSVLFPGVSAHCSCHKQKSGQDLSRRTIVVASWGKENDKRWHVHPQEALLTASQPALPSVNQSEKAKWVTMYAIWLLASKDPQEGKEILTTPGARKAVTLLYADKSVCERRKMLLEQLWSGLRKEIIFVKVLPSRSLCSQRSPGRGTFLSSGPYSWHRPLKWS